MSLSIASLILEAIRNHTIYWENIPVKYSHYNLRLYDFFLNDTAPHITIWVEYNHWAHIPYWISRFQQLLSISETVTTSWNNQFHWIYIVAWVCIVRALSYVFVVDFVLNIALIVIEPLSRRVVIFDNLLAKSESCIWFIARNICAIAVWVRVHCELCGTQRGCVSQKNDVCGCNYWL